VTHLPSAPGLLVSALPRVLGREPADAVVVVGLAAHAPGTAVLLSADLDGDPIGTADDLLDAAAEDGAEAVAVVVYAADAADLSSRAAVQAAAVVLRAELRDVTTVDALWVSTGRYASYLCSTPSCCPPEGSPVPTPEETP
jgi:Domain of unknown function (DUF4192)